MPVVVGWSVHPCPQIEHAGSCVAVFTLLGLCICEACVCIRLVKKEEQNVESVQATQQQLPALLARLEGNLAKELCHISEQDHLTMTQLLKPVQVSDQHSKLRCAYAAQAHNM